MKRLVSLLALLVSIAALLAPTALAQAPEVEISSFDKPSFGHSTASMLSANKFDEKNGVKIKWLFKQSRAANMDFAAGRDKITFSSSLLAEANRRLKGVKSVWLFNVVPLHGALLTEDPNLKTLKDLEGKTIAADTVTTNYAMFRYFALKAGADLNKVRIQSSNAPGLGTLLLAKRVDAAQVWEPNLSHILDKNPGRFRNVEYVDDWLRYNKRPMRGYLGVAAHEDFVAGNREIIQKVYRAFKDLEAWVPSHHNEAAAIVSEATGIAPAAIKAALTAKRLGYDVVSAGAIAEQIKDVFKAGLEIGYMKEMPDDGIIYTGLKE